MLYQRTINVNVTFKISIIHSVRTIQREYHNKAIDGDMKSERHYTQLTFVPLSEEFIQAKSLIRVTRKDLIGYLHFNFYNALARRKGF